ncbi:MAG: hypothetical protein JWO88_3897, partial [Frankiales bacterium]|nr:hypothetical protein [Frankiales bacterium]
MRHLSFRTGWSSALSECAWLMRLSTVALRDRRDVGKKHPACCRHGGP